MRLEFYRQIFEYTQIPKFMKTRPVGADLFHAGGRTDGQRARHDETSRFTQFFEKGVKTTLCRIN